MIGETPWMGQLLTKYNNAEAHTFVLHMNVQDYVVPGRTLVEYLTARLARQDLIVTYDITRGITFSDDAGAARATTAPTSRCACSAGTVGLPEEVPTLPCLKRLVALAGPPPRHAPANCHAPLATRSPCSSSS
jgi:hypothetical protein